MSENIAIRFLGHIAPPPTRKPSEYFHHLKFRLRDKKKKVLKPSLNTQNFRKY